MFKLLQELDMWRAFLEIVLLARVAWNNPKTGLWDS